MKVRLNTRKQRRIKKVRSKIKGTDLRPRLSVFRSNRFFYAQIIDDLNAKTLVSVGPKDLASKNETKINRTQQAMELGEIIGKKAIEAKIKGVVFDRRSYQYHGRVAAFAQGVKKSGLIF